MKYLFFVCGLLLAPFVCADDSTPVVKLYSEAYYNGNVLGFTDQHHINGPLQLMSTHVITMDAFDVVGENKASSMQVSHGYCVIVTTERAFQGAKKVFGEGDYNLLPSPFNNNIESMAIYKKITDQDVPCDPGQQIPMVYDGYLTGDSYPLPFANGKALPNLESCSFPQCSPYYDGPPFSYRSSPGRVRLGSHLWDDIRRLNSSYTYRVGAFSKKASSLFVPECYTVTLEKTNSHRRTFSAGTYNLAHYGYSNNTWRAEIDLIDGCVQQVTEPEPDNNLPEGEDCEWVFYTSSSTGNNTGGSSTTVYQSVGACKHSYKSVTRYWSPYNSGSTTSYQ